ncbi:glycylpeptide N-tetradecanoyltransferase [Vermiconidia calcicola]|uniref:Glycylpeptide N-tetradecanoyltransferase n=1 Tax=Vermiconidia calcicola TaxID=1690605 RepID=A0ACC3NNB5_9PEZI|nr:glycylpeptide N-tetradecanoyltransferase [Vermiconidia calcicola]
MKGRVALADAKSNQTSDADSQATFEKMAAEEGKSGNAQTASDLADNSLEAPSETSKAADSLADGADGEEAGSEEEDVDEEETQAQAGAAATTSSKKKKKPKKKKKKAADGSAESSSSAVSSQQPIQPTQVHDIQSLLKQLALSQQQPKREGKAPEDYKFWNTQPVPKFREPNLLQTTDGANGESLPEGAILPDKVCRASAKAEPEKLVDGFEWCLVDLDDKEELHELYDLLDNHYVEDTDGSFRFRYSEQFLSWALKPPGWRKDWHIGVRTKGSEDGKKGKLVAFIAGIPVTLKVGSQQKFNATEINFLTIHRKLRGKRLAPVLIKEVTRRCYLNDIYQALYTAGTLLPTPISTCRYFHRSLDWEHLYKTGFSHVPSGTTELRQKYKYRIDPNTKLKGLRPMKSEDIPAVKALLTRYLERFHLRQEWTTEEIDHWICSEASKGVVSSFVVEKEGGGISDFVSYYLLESTVLRSNSRGRDTIRAAYLYYYATESAFPIPNTPKPKARDLQETLAHRLRGLMHDALVLAKKDDYHVFNALTLLDNPLFLKEEKFEPGDGKLNYYLFNWRTESLGGGVDERNEIDTSRMGGVGVVML